MQELVSGFAGWARMRKTDSETLRVTDTAITVLGTLLVAVTFVILHG